MVDPAVQSSTKVWILYSNAMNLTDDGQRDSKIYIYKTGNNTGYHHSIQ